MAQAQSPFQQFFDSSGDPLDDGSIYIGVAGQNPETNPQQIYWDDAATIPAAQPLKTLNGYLVRNGTPAIVYVTTGSYSMTVKSRTGEVVFSILTATSPISYTDLSGQGTASQLGFTPYKNISATDIQSAIEEEVDDLGADTGSSLVGFVQASVNAVARTVQSKLREPYLSVVDFGAVGDGTTAVDTAVVNAFNAALASGLPLFFPAGAYKFATTGQTTWDFSGYNTKTLKIFGAGSGRTVLNFPNVTSGIAFQLRCNTDWYDLSMSDMAITGSLPGVLLCIGNNDYSDPLNVANFTNLIVLNPSNNAAAEAIRLNYVVNSNFIGVRGNCYADGLGNNTGTALRARQVEFCTFVNGSYGNAEYGVRFTDGFNFGNVFIGTDHENVAYCVSTDTPNSGNNTFIGGQFSLWTAAAFKRTGSLSTNAITVLNANYSNGASPAPIIDAANFGKIRLIDGRPIATPAFPASTVNVANTTGKKVLVTFWGGTTSQVTVNGFGIGIPSGSVVVEHGQTISLTYTGSPTWLWQPLE